MPIPDLAVPYAAPMPADISFSIFEETWGMGQLEAAAGGSRTSEDHGCCNTGLSGSLVSNLKPLERMTASAAVADSPSQ